MALGEIPDLSDLFLYHIFMMIKDDNMQNSCKITLTCGRHCAR